MPTIQALEKSHQDSLIQISRLQEKNEQLQKDSELLKQSLLQSEHTLLETEYKMKNSIQVSEEKAT